MMLMVWYFFFILVMPEIQFYINCPAKLRIGEIIPNKGIQASIHQYFNELWDEHDWLIVDRCITECRKALHITCTNINDPFDKRCFLFSRDQWRYYFMVGRKTYA